LSLHNTLKSRRRLTPGGGSSRSVAGPSPAWIRAGSIRQSAGDKRTEPLPGWALRAARPEQLTIRAGWKDSSNLDEMQTAQGKRGRHPARWSVSRPASVRSTVIAPHRDPPLRSVRFFRFVLQTVEQTR